MSIEVCFFIFCGVCFALIFTITRYLKSDWKFTLTFLAMAIFILAMLYLYGLDQYKLNRNLKAFESTHQIEQCGTFQKNIAFQSFGKHKLAYEFKTDEQRLLNFNGDALTQHYYPLLTELKTNDRICFKYAEDVLDWEQRFYLLKLSKP